MGPDVPDVPDVPVVPTSDRPGLVLIGTSGWNYATGKGTWNGVFYPSRRPRDFDELAYYAEHFDTVEVNSSFYRMPEPGMSQSWVRRTPRSFQFAVKLYQKFTHPDMYLSRNAVSDWDLSLADVDLFRRGIDPLAEAGRLTAVLIQFPPSFQAAAETQDYLDWLLAALRGYRLAVELRHRSWSDETADTLARLRAHDASWVLIDEPKFGSSVRQKALTDHSASPGDPSGLTYIRLHGRNAAQWWDHDESEDRYDYHYSPAELAPFASIARSASSKSRRVLLYMNNHFSAKSVANATILKHQLGQPITGEVPRELVARFPDLAGIVTTSESPVDLPLDFRE
jgi:uncharacterized protein YecE (DUF72 family)